MYDKQSKVRIYKLINFILALVNFLFFFSINLHAEELISFNKSSQNLQVQTLLTPNEKKWIKNHSNIRVAVKSGWMPIEFQLENKLHRGYTIDYLQKIANLYQINFEVVDYSLDIDSSTADIITAISGHKLNNKNFNLLSQPFLTIPNAIYINKNHNNKFKAKDLEELKMATVAVYNKSNLPKTLKKNFPNLKLVTVDIADEAFDYLKSGTIDAYVGNEFVVDYHIDVHRLNFVDKSGLTPFTSEISMAVRDDSPELTSIMEKATTSIGQNNQELMGQWRSEKNISKIVLEIFSALILISFAIFAARYIKFKNNASKLLAENQKKIWHQANYDYLTDLPNRNLLQSNIKKVILKAEKDKSKFALIFIDLDNFKHINDNSGHSKGDELLKSCAVRISQCVKLEDITARLGGDEFMILVSDFENEHAIELNCKKILNSIQQPFEIGSETFFISASIGVTIYPDHSIDSEELMSFADQAMYESKKLGRNRYQFFNQSLKVEISNKISIINDLRSAIKNHQFELYYQPIINLSDSTIIKAEALIRWIHPHKGLISPIEFIPLAEETGLIVELGHWIFEQATNDLNIIRNKTNSNLHLSINISPVQFLKPESLTSLINIINKKNIAGEFICLEITEGLFLDPSPSVTETIKLLGENGIKFSIDDFGTGYSALAYLQNFKIDYLKIDKSFIQNVEKNNFDEALCGFIIQMAHKLGIYLIAEGVEELNQEQILKALGCDYAQGYFYGKPMNLIEFIGLLDQNFKRNEYITAKK
jgi:diguanylate cyclase (GGDEF)-like protein